MRAVQLIRRATARRWVGVYRVRDSKVENLAWSGVGPPAHPVFDVDRGLTATAVATARTVVSNDVASDPRYLANQPTSASELIVPILSAGHVVGTLDVEDAATDAFDADDSRLFERLAGALTALSE
jgi:GAF domain-containing protein